MLKIEIGYCQCGCGKQTRIANRNDFSDNLIKGQYKRFIKGHNSKLDHPHNWKGGSIDSQGYKKVYCADHVKANKQNGSIHSHILIVEKILGKLLPEKAIVHHVNGIKTDNRPENLVICQDRAYHNLLHKRMRALKTCGHVSWIKCKYCGTYDDPKGMYIGANNNGRHRECHAEYELARYYRNK